MNEEKKLCSDCKTTKTPLWRTGPCGPRSLCNACGIRYRKRKLAIGNSNIPEIKTEKPSSSSSSSTCSSNPVDDYHDHDQHQHQHKMNESLKMRINDLGNQMVTHRSRSPQLKRQRSSSGVDSSKKYGEVEQAAALLMSLSCASVYA